MLCPCFGRICHPSVRGVKCKNCFGPVESTADEFPTPFYTPRRFVTKAQESAEKTRKIPSFESAWTLAKTDAGSLRGKGNRRPANFAKTAVVAENILVAAQDGAHDERIISVADLRNRIWDDVCFLGHITKRKRSFLL